MYSNVFWSETDWLPSVSSRFVYNRREAVETQHLPVTFACAAQGHVSSSHGTLTIPRRLIRSLMKNDYVRYQCVDLPLDLHTHRVAAFASAFFPRGNYLCRARFVAEKLAQLDKTSSLSANGVSG